LQSVYLIDAVQLKLPSAIIWTLASEAWLTKRGKEFALSLIAQHPF
jgi:hypothetical protein